MDFEGLTEDEIWAAGVLSVFGSFATMRNASTIEGRPDAISAKLSVRSLSHFEAVQKFAEVAGTEAKTVKVGDSEGLQVVLTSKKLHAFMTRLWPALPKRRKQEYAAIRRAMKEGRVAQVGAKGKG